MSDMETTWLVVAGVLGLAVVSFVVYLIVSTARSRPPGGGRHRAPSRKRPHRDTFRTEEPEPEPKKRAAVIVQDGSDLLRAEIASQSTAPDWEEPLWLPADDVIAAAAAARAALDTGVDVVCVCGDSAVERGVAGMLAGTETPLAFLPGGGGLRGVLGVPVAPEVPGVSGLGGPVTAASREMSPRETWPNGDPVSDRALAAAMTTALTGQNTRVHVGRAVLAPPPAPEHVVPPGAAVVADREVASAKSAARVEGEVSTGSTPSQTLTDVTPTEVVFLHSLVVGDIVPHTEPALTTRTVARSLFKGTSFTATVTPDDEEEITRPARSVAFEIGADRPGSDRSSPDDSAGEALDAYLHASQSLKGWTGVARAMMRKSSRPTPLLVPLRSVAFTLTLDKPADLTIDGLAVGTAHPGESTISLERHALVVRR